MALLGTEYVHLLTYICIKALVSTCLEKGQVPHFSMGASTARGLSLGYGLTTLGMRGVIRKNGWTWVSGNPSENLNLRGAGK